MQRAKHATTRRTHIMTHTVHNVNRTCTKLLRFSEIMQKHNNRKIHLSHDYAQGIAKHVQRNKLFYITFPFHCVNYINIESKSSA